MGGADYGDIVATAAQTRYHEVRHAPFEGGLADFVHGEVDAIDPGGDNRLYIYYPAPPAGMTNVDVTIGEGTPSAASPCDDHTASSRAHRPGGPAAGRPDPAGRAGRGARRWTGCPRAFSSLGRWPQASR